VHTHSKTGAVKRTNQDLSREALNQLFNIFLNPTRYMTSSKYAVVARSIIIDNPAESVWITLKAFGGNEKFNPLVTSSKLDGYGVGSKRICNVYLNPAGVKRCLAVQSPMWPDWVIV
jgi:hypothetical protein